jgi:hypothetical protein
MMLHRWRNDVISYCKPLSLRDTRVPYLFRLCGYQILIVIGVKILARKAEDRLTEADKDAKRALGDKAVRALIRLSAIPMPQIRFG